MKNAVFSLLASIALPAFCATVHLPMAPDHEFADTESVTNAAIRADALAGAQTFDGTISLYATMSNAVEVAFGAADSGGALAPGAETFAVGWDGGRWFFASETNRFESSEISGSATRTLSFSMRVASGERPRALSICADGAGAAFDALCESPPDWLFSREWNVVRLTIRGVDPAGESVAVRFATDPGTLIFR